MTTLTRMKSAPVESSLPQFRSEMNRLLDDAFRPPSWAQPTGWSAAQAATPALDVVETSDAYVVMAEVPGLSPDSLDVQVEGTSLTLRGTKSPPQLDGGEAVHRERAFGAFCRTVALPGAIEADEIRASCEHGVLTVQVPKSAAARARRIEIYETT